MKASGSEEVATKKPAPSKIMKSSSKKEKVPGAKRTASKVLKKEEEELVAEAVIVPPDGGWGWVIVAMSFLTNAIVDGLIFTVGQGFLPLWEAEFTQGSAGKAAWAVSLLSGCYLLVGPIVSSVANIFGCQITAMIGTFIASLGFILSMFASNIWFLYVSFGVIGGIGLGFIYLPSIVIVSYYFEKRRALATGIAVCGSGIGTFLCAPLIRFLLDTYTWRPTLLLLGGIILHCHVFAAFYRKLTPTRRQMAQITQKLHAYDEHQQHPRLHAPKSTAASTVAEPLTAPQVKTPPVKRTTPTTAPSETPTSAAPPSTPATAPPQTTMTTSASTPPSTTAPRWARRPVSLQENAGNVIEKAPPNGLLASGVEFERFGDHSSVDIDQSSGGKRRSTSAVQRAFRSTMDLSYYRRRTNPSLNLRHRRSCVPPDKNEQDSPMINLTVDSNTSADEIEEDPVYQAATRRSVVLLNRPLSRMDIFYAGSVQNLPEFKSQPDVRHFLASTISITRPLEKESESEDETDEKPLAKKGIKGALKGLLDFSLFRSPTFILLALSGFFTLTGFFVPFIYLPQMARSFGHSPAQATMLVSALGVTNIVARILCGWVSDGLPRCGRRKPAKRGSKTPAAKRWANSDGGGPARDGSSASLRSKTPAVDGHQTEEEDEPRRSPALFINNTALILAGLATMVVPHCKPYPLLVLYCVVFGVGTACFASLRSVICVQLLGLERLTNAYGLLLLFMGIASLVGTPLAGILFDYTHTFNLSFYIMGALVAVSGLLGIPLPHISRWEQRRSEQKQQARRRSYSSSTDSEDEDDHGSGTVKKPLTKVTTKTVNPSIVVFQAPETLDEDDEEANANTITSTSSKTLKNGLGKAVKA